VDKHGGGKNIRSLFQRARWSLRIRRERWLASIKYRWLALRHNPVKPASSDKAITDRTPLQGRFCPNPFNQIDLEEGGVAYTCCSGWLPTPMGNLKQNSLMESWNGETMKRIRESIFDGSFRYCRHDRCPMIQNDSLPTLAQARNDPLFTRIIDEKATRLERPPTFINLVNDRSCNLHCPSCRRERINHTEGAVYEETALLQKRLLEPYLATPNDQHFTLSVTGSGDPFASRVYRELLYSLKGSDFPNMKIALQTNGVLLTPRNWERMKGVHDNISSIIISMDAATEETYKLTRRGGHWKTLMDNAARMGEIRSRGECRKLRFDFVVQKENFREMKDFVVLSKSLGADEAYFSRLLDWGTWPKDTFMEQCVWEEGHPLRDEFMEVMRNPVFDDPYVDMGNMSDLRTLALNN
jgi:sulfatase maturation enzyme AslB (radical SAM superfamily)